MLTSFIQIARTIPQAEAVPSAGTSMEASASDHKHPRLTSVTVHTVGANGLTPVTFKKEDGTNMVFDKAPGIDCMLVENAATTQPVIFSVDKYTLAGVDVPNLDSPCDGCVVRARRSTTLPNLGLITLVTGLVNALTNFNLFQGVATGASFSVIAIKRTG